jgi:hypothetical protein
MNLGQQQHRSSGLLGEMKAVVDSLPINKRKELMVALKEIFSELAESAEEADSGQRSVEKCFARA